MPTIYKKTLLFAAIPFLLAGCKKWDDHNAITDPDVEKNLMQQIQADEGLSTFAGLLVKSGYDKEITSSKTYTVFAPTNTALQNLDPALVNDAAKLKAFVGNHIANQLYNSKTALTDTVRIPMLNGKFHSLIGTNLDDAAITAPDKIAKNGLIHTINKMLPALQNTWEVMENDPRIPAAHKTFLQSLYKNVFDAENAEQIGVNPNTGAPIYKPGTDSVRTNSIWQSVYDVRNEEGQYTMFVLSDEAWAAETGKIIGYYQTDSVGMPEYFSKWNVARNTVVQGAYTPSGAGTDTLQSKSGVRFPVEASAIVHTIKTSNGMVYVLNKMDVLPNQRYRSIVVEGERYAFTSHDKRGNTYFRDRYNPLTGTDFKDVLVLNHAQALFNLAYNVPDVITTKYKVYWVAVNDFQTATHQQRISIGTSTAGTLPYTVVPVNNFGEQYIGEMTISKFNTSTLLFLVAANSTSQAVSPLVCDYIRLEPVF